MLTANYSYINRICGHNHSGPTNPCQWIAPHTMRSYYTYTDVGPNSEQIKRDSFPTGTNPPYSLIMGDKGCLLVSSNTTNGIGTLSGSAAMGRAIASNLSGSGTISTANLSLIVQLVCNTLSGSGTLTASMSGIVQLASNLAGVGALTASLNLLASIICNISGTSTLTAGLRGTASLEADITPFTALSPESLAASLWNSLAASFDDPGTMGEIMNSIGAGADPWNTPLPGSYPAGTAGYLLGNSEGGVILAQGTILSSDINRTVLDSGAEPTNNTFVGSKIIIISGTGVGQMRLIKQYSASRLLVPTVPWYTVPDNTSGYIIIP